MHKSSIINYLRSPSTLLGVSVGLLMYLCYALEDNAWSNLGLIFVSVLIALIIPSYSKLSNKAEELIEFRTVNLTLGRLGRFLTQLVINLLIFYIFVGSGVIKQSNLTGVDGIIGIALLTTIASQGMQYIALMLSNREIGDKNRNVLAALSLNIIITSFAALGWLIAKDIFVIIGIMSALLVFGMGLLSDLRAKLYPKKGIGIFFGTFNPFHKSHAAIVKRAIEERNLSKVIIHPTVIPKLHSEALRKGEIEIAEHKDGMRIYRKTKKADVNVNYFPTGNRFYEHRTREFIIAQAIKEIGLEDVVEIWSLPNTYLENGFYGIISEIKQRYPDMPLHGIHGSDLGGMWVRGIYDESGWIYPYPVKRVDNVSATAIRNGAKGMATQAVENIIHHLRNNNTEFVLNNDRVRVENGEIYYA